MSEEEPAIYMVFADVIRKCDCQVRHTTGMTLRIVVAQFERCTPPFECCVVRPLQFFRKHRVSVANLDQAAEPVDLGNRTHARRQLERIKGL